MGNLTPPAPPHVVISVMRRTFYKNGERMIENSGTSIFTAETSAFNVYSQLFCLFSSLSQARYVPVSLKYTSSIYVRIGTARLCSATFYHLFGFGATFLPARNFEQLFLKLAFFSNIEQIMWNNVLEHNYLYFNVNTT